MKYFSWLLSVTSKIKVKTIVVTLREKLKIIKEKILSNRFYLWLFTGSVTLLCFLLPSIIYSFIEKTYRVKFFGYEFFLFFVPMAFSLAATRTITACFLLFFFMLLELMQFGHLIYFGFHLNPFSIELATTGITDIVDVLLGLIGKVWHLPFLVLIPYCLLIALYKKTSKHRAQYYIVVVILFYFVSKYYCEMELISNEVFKHVENLGDIQVNTLMPIDTKISLDNSLKSFSAFLYDRLPAIASGKKIIIKKKYDEYIIEKNNVDKPVNIILIVGESVNSERMSLFDYERDTTPLLKKMSLEDENFVFKKALSSSVLTHISLNFLINIQREPDNIEHLLSRKADMFKLAKNNGFSTAYISAHNDRLLASISVSDVGKIITNKTGLKEKIKEHGEIYFVRYIKEIIKEELLKTDKNFLVIHLR
ncbi:MAG: sulfatase-like hydrolase/transferase, partial [Rickettsiales bacterium]|nr:sulfatase-like hydrolase/transferase [Rickettsiales bacterium]